jgi:periplasmic divalent cation tolerance protein
MAAEALVALSTFPDEETARRIVRELVEARLVACGNILPGVESIYRWEGKVQSGQETLVVFKLPGEKYADFETKLKALHPYDVPEIIAVEVARGGADYLRWIAESCRSQS